MKSWTTKKMTSRLEGTLKDKCMGWAKAHPDIWLMKVMGNSIQTGGVPDILACHKGRFIAIELKRPDGEGTLAKRQEAQLSRIIRAGGIGAVVESLDQFKELFND